MRREVIGAHDMTFEDSPQSGGASPRYLGEGFRLEPTFRDPASGTSEYGRELASGTTRYSREPATGSLSSGSALPGREAITPFQPLSGTAVDMVASEPTTLPLSRRASGPNLDYVFDDPAEGEPGRDRMLVHGLWELLLAVALAGVGYLLYRQNSGAFGGDALRTLLLSASILGLLAAGSAVALRAAAPNLAVGAVAAAAALYFGHSSDGGLLQPLLVVIGACVAIGVVQGLIVVGLHVPSWAASIGVALVLLIWSDRQAAVTLFDGYGPLPHAYWWFGAFCAVSVGASIVGLVPSIRRTIGRFRPVADPAQRRGTVAAVIALGATVLSTILAGISGVLAVSVTDAAGPSAGFELTALALGAALLGGTSAFGRRGGIFGTVFAAGLITVGIAYAETTGRSWHEAAFAAVAIGLGLGVTRLVELFGRPDTGDEDDDDDDEAWGTKVRSSPAAGGLWASDDAWGSADQR